MSVAPLTKDENEPPSHQAASAQAEPSSKANEALMILGMDKQPDESVVKSLIESEGVLDASVLEL